MDNSLPSETARFLDELAEAVGWHRLKEFLDLLHANPGLIDHHDLPDESADMFREMQRLKPGAAMADVLNALEQHAEWVDRYVDDHL